MTVTVVTGRDLGLSKGQHRTAFRNPRGNKRYYAMFKGDGVTSHYLYYRWSTTGDSWAASPPSILNYGTSEGNIHSYDVKIHDDGSQLEVWIVTHGYDNVADEYQTKYIYGTISDSSDTISWSTVQIIDAAINPEMTGPHCIALARTDNGELVVAFTEDYTSKGKDYRLTKLIGSNGDGAAPSWSGETIWDDPSADSDNQNKDEVWFGLESFSSSYPNRVLLCGRFPDGLTTSAYDGNTVVPDWNSELSTFTNTTKFDVGLPGGTTAKILCLLIDESDYCHWVYFHNASYGIRHRKSGSAGDDDWGIAVNVSGDPEDHDACTCALDAPLDIPTSTEQNTGWSVNGAATAHEATDDGYPVDADGDTTYVRSASGSDVLRLGGFEGGTDPIYVVCRHEGVDAGWVLETYKDGLWVETLTQSGQESAVYSTITFTPTNSDWNEIRITRGINVLRITAIGVDRSRLCVFFHEVANTVDFHYATSPVGTISFSVEKIVSYHQDIIALSSWNRQIENSLHIAALYGTTILYNEHPVYKALSTTLADFEFPYRNVYLGPHNT